MKAVLLKGVPEEDWTVFKSEAVTHHMKIGEFLSYLVREHSKKGHGEERLKRILSYRSGRSEEKLKRHEEFISRFRKEFTLKR